MPHNNINRNTNITWHQKLEKSTRSYFNQKEKYIKTFVIKHTKSPLP